METPMKKLSKVDNMVKKVLIMCPKCGDIICERKEDKEGLIDVCYAEYIQTFISEESGYILAFLSKCRTCDSYHLILV